MNYAIYVLAIILILFDVITGLLKAIKNHDLDSTILREGLYHKLAEILAMLCPAILYYGAKYTNIDIPFPLPEFVCTYISVMEIVSSIENLCEVNPDLFKLFQPFLKKLKDRGDTDERKGN